jgi:hypothetical protein
LRLCVSRVKKLIHILVDVEGVNSLVGVFAMESPDEGLICKVLDALHKVLDVMGANGRRMVELLDGDVLLGEFATNHPSATATKQASEILQLFFGYEVIEDEENDAPLSTTNKTFDFGIMEKSISLPFSFRDNSTS